MMEMFGQDEEHRLGKYPQRITRVSHCCFNNMPETPANIDVLNFWKPALGPFGCATPHLQIQPWAKSTPIQTPLCRRRTELFGVSNPASDAQSCIE